MTVEAFDRAIQQASDAGYFIDDPMPASEADVDELARVIGTLPESYRHFLLIFGTVSIEGIELYGLIPDRLSVESVPNTFWLTRELKEKEGLPESFLVVEDLGDGSYACLALGAEVGIEAPVVVWELATPSQPLNKLEILSSSFGEYVEKRVADLLA